MFSRAMLLLRSGRWIATLVAMMMVLPSVSGVTLEWDPSPDAWVAGYAIRYGTTSSNYTVRVDAGNKTSATITNLTEGATYYFVATAYTSDGQESLPSNEVAYTVPVTATNQAPMVSAGSDQLITLPSSAALYAIVTDDGLPPTPGSVTVAWTMVSGAGTVTFANAAATSTTASFSKAGTYVLRLTANDGLLSASDDLTVTVSPANTAPVVNAGPDQAITLPANATLTALVKDDGQPTTPGNVTVAWTMVSGAGQIDFSNATASKTRASFPAAGVYVIRLTASDGQLTTSDELTVTVTQDSPVNPVGVVLEAESGLLSEPMLVGTNSDARTSFIGTTAPSEGTASYGLDVRESGEYIIWARVQASENTSNTLYVSADGGSTNILRANVDGAGADAWHWVRVTVKSSTTRAASSTVPSVFKFDTGYHTVTVSGGDTGVLVDKFIVTNDPNFVPTELAVNPPSPKISHLAWTPDGSQVSWNTLPGLTYRLVYKENLSDTQWLPASPDVVAFGNQLTWTDETAGAASRRFYSILIVR